MLHPTVRIAHTIAFVTPVVEHWLEREIAQWVPHEGSIGRPIALTTEPHLAFFEIYDSSRIIFFCHELRRVINKGYISQGTQVTPIWPFKEFDLNLICCGQFL